ncbi:MAG TPA: tetratricopeptide repeat protein [Candidatus Acidoferrales bacterium]|jgi:serine/threonine-protein kinase|nr:tetratricopeptide repeat protein [Candidatus Acidoferrales bacterium]
MPLGESETIQMVDATVIAPGSDFGPRYRIEVLLGQGGMGRVYKAYDKDLDRTVAIKVVRDGAIGESDALKRFKQELVLASKISHKNILRIHDMGDVGGLRFISMAFVEGKDLQHIIRENPKMPLQRILNFSRQIAEALAAAHAEGVVHRDLKPQNLLVDKNDQIFVCDFGLAKSFEEGAIGMTRTGAFLGTPRYMSPEQVEGKPADGRADLYAFGLILYEMVIGDVPFTGESTLKVMYQRIQEKPKSPKILRPDLPNWLVKIIMRCLERDPNDRYQNAYEILADMQGGSSGSVSRVGMSRIGSGSQSVIIQIPEFASRRWVWVVAGVVALLLIAFAIPPVRHLIPGFHVEQTGPAGSAASGIPPLSSGRYVAILPLQVLGDQSQLGYLAQGIQEALAAKLFQLKGVHVTSSDAAAKADPKQPVEKIARSLGANTLVQGMVQGNGDKIRIILNMEDAVNGKRIWSQQFDGVPADLFTLEDHIYAQVVGAMDVNPTNEENANAEARPTDNVASYDFYLRGRNALRVNDAKSIQTALDYFNQAVKQDPKFALAYTGVAQASLRMFGLTNDGFWTQKALAAAQQALQLNDKLPEVHSTLGSVYRATGKYSEAIAELNRAQALAPNSDEVYYRLGNVYMSKGDMPHAIEAFQKAVQLNPYYWINENSLGVAYFQVGEYDKALDAFKQVSTLEPDVNAGYENAGNVLVQQAKYSEAVPSLQKALAIEPNAGAYSNLGTAYFFLKQYAESAQAFEKAVALNANDTQLAVNLGDAYRALGQTDKAHAAYQQAISAGYKELQTNPQDTSVLAEVALSYANLGKPQDADTFIARARAQDKKDVNLAYTEVQINALNGKPSQALTLLAAVLADHYPAESAAVDPDLESLHSNPEFAKLIKKYSTKP